MKSVKPFFDHIQIDAIAKTVELLTKDIDGIFAITQGYNRFNFSNIVVNWFIKDNRHIMTLDVPNNDVYLVDNDYLAAVGRKIANNILKDINRK